MMFRISTVPEIRSLVLIQGNIWVVCALDLQLREVHIRHKGEERTISLDKLNPLMGVLWTEL